MRNARPIRRAARLQRALEQSLKKLPCPLCVELDHSAGRNHDSELTFEMCRVHHSDVTESRRQADVSMRYESDPVKRVALALRATSVFLQALADALWRWSELLNPTEPSLHRSNDTRAQGL